MLERNLFHTTRSDRRQECAIDYFGMESSSVIDLSNPGVQTRKLRGSNNIIYRRRCNDHWAKITRK